MNLDKNIGDNDDDNDDDFKSIKIIDSKVPSKVKEWPAKSSGHPHPCMRQTAAAAAAQWAQQGAQLWVSKARRCIAGGGQVRSRQEGLGQDWCRVRLQLHSA